jgi:transposase InsO family protein
VDDNYRTPLITSAIQMAARNADLPADAIFHSDRGSNYTSAEFAAVLEGWGSACQPTALGPVSTMLSLNRSMPR